MNRGEIVEELYRTGQVQKMVYKILSSSKNPFDCPEDLIQDIYVILMEKEGIEEMWERNELGYFLLKVIRNQLLSKNSPYYYKYIKTGIYEELEEGIVEEDRG